MKLGEALSERADLIRRIQDVDGRIAANVLAQEGDEPGESPQALLEQADRLADRLQQLIGAINLTNANSRLSDGATVTEALAERDVLGTRVRTLRNAIQHATNHLNRYGLSEIRQERQVDIADLQERHDRYARRRRELDTMIQAHNWTTDLIEEA